jgi:hypothetical protein
MWRRGILIYPDVTAISPPNPDLPDDIKDDYEEARSIASKSPRGAAALLRLCIQKLCKHLGEPGKDLNKDIGSLVEKGLPKRIQKALDAVRVIGNEAVHPGEINLNDNPEIVGSLFQIIDIIVDDRITQPREIDELYNTLPEAKRRGIETRDKNNNSDE